MPLMLVPILFAAAAAQPAANPLAPALAGQMECHFPNDQAKTCRSIGTYKPVGGDRYSNNALVLLSPEGPVTLEVATEVTVKNGAVCGTVKREDLNKAQLKVGDHVLTAAEATQGMEQIAQAMAPLFDKEICSTFEPAGAIMMVKSTLGGTARPDLDQPMKWIAPADGYKVAP
jgi:hypothetical protein